MRRRRLVWKTRKETFGKQHKGNFLISGNYYGAVFHLVFQAKWSDEFNKNNNTDDVFHAPGGDVQAEYMNKKLKQMNYYWGENYSAVDLYLKNGSRMWFILPDEGKSLMWHLPWI